MKLKYTGATPAETFIGGRRRRIVPGEEVDFPDDVAKLRLSEGTWKKVPAPRIKKEGE